MDKNELRQNIRHSLNKMTIDQYEQKSNIIRNRLADEPYIIEGSTIALTVSNYPEVDTSKIIEYLWEVGKKVVVPKCQPKTRMMDFYAINNFQQLETVYMDLKEPIPEKTEFVPPDQIDVIVVPGIVYDQKGYRVGYGGGYYDRYLQNYAGTLVSLAFDRQIVHSVPKQAHDIPVHFIVTETNRIDCMK